MASPVKVLDSWAVISFLEGEPGANVVEKILLESLQQSTQLMMTTVNLGEVWYNIARRYSSDVADQAVAQVRSLGVDVISADWDLTYQAAKFKVRGGISLADCFAAALALIEGAALVTGDLEFKQVEDQVIIEWI
jgi:predicted nucleic acid-binding protein